MKVVLTTLILLFFLPAHGASPIMFVGTHFPKILAPDAKGQPEGLAVDIIQQIMASLNYPYSIDIVPWKRAQRLVKGMDADVLIGPYKTQQRNQELEYSQYPFYLDEMVLFGQYASEFTWQGDFSALKGKILAVPLGWTGGPNFEKYKHVATLYQTSTLEHGLKMLALNRVDLVLANLRNAKFIIEKEAIEQKLRLIKPSIQPNYGYFAFTKNEARVEFKQDFTKALHALYKSGQLTVLNHKRGLKFELQ